MATSYNASQLVKADANALPQQGYTSGGKQAPIKKAVKVKTSKELKKELKEAQKRERQYRKAEKRVKAAQKEAERLVKVALEALEYVATSTDGGMAAVEAARTLLGR